MRGMLWPTQPFEVRAVLADLRSRLPQDRPGPVLPGVPDTVTALAG